MPGHSGPTGRAPGSLHAIAVSGSAWPCPLGQEGSLREIRTGEEKREAPRRQWGKSPHLLCLCLAGVSLSLSRVLSHLFSFLLRFSLCSVSFLFPFPSVSPSLSFSISLCFYFPPSAFLLDVQIQHPVCHCDVRFSAGTVQILGCRRDDTYSHQKAPSHGLWARHTEPTFAQLPPPPSI